MDERSLVRPDADGDFVESALRADGREHRATYLDDDGFTTRLMAALPPAAALPAWRKPALTALWAIAALGIAFALPNAFIDVAHSVLRVLIGQPVSFTGIAASIVAAGVVSWLAAAALLRDD